MNIFSSFIRKSEFSTQAMLAIVFGWILFAIALLLPAVEETVQGGRPERFMGWECLWISIVMSPSTPLYIPIAISNIAMLCTPYYAARSLMGANAKFVAYWIGGAFIAAILSSFLVDAILCGYFAWSSSFLFVATGFYRLGRANINGSSQIIMAEFRG